MAHHCTTDCDDPALISALATSHGVAIERVEPVCVHLVPLLDELFTRLTRCGWRKRRVAQVKMKFGSLRVFVSRDDETPAFIEFAGLLTSEVRRRSGGR